MEILNENNFDETISKHKIVLIDFFAVWCGPCRMQGPILEDVAEKYKDNDNVKIFKVDVDENEKISARYSIMSIPTLIIFKDGEVNHKYIGLTDQDEIEEKINSLL